ncbi:unnamed protein product, partial [Musa acuminata var. zebrina]
MHASSASSAPSSFFPDPKEGAVHPLPSFGALPSNDAWLSRQQSLCQRKVL